MKEPAGIEWQTVLLYAGVVIAAVWMVNFWQRKNNPPWKEFHVVGLIADMVEGNWRISATKFMAFGAFIISAIGVVVCVIRGKVPPEFVGLLTIFGGIYVLGSLGNRQINTNAEVNIRKAEISHGRRPDEELTVEEQEERRRKTDRLSK